MINKKIRSIIFFIAVSMLFIFSHPVFCAVPVPDGQYTIAATVVPVDKTNRSQSGNDIYITSFNKALRQGDLKKYELACFETDGGIEKCDPEWSAGELLKESMPGTNPINIPAPSPSDNIVDKYQSFRNIYTYLNGTLVKFNRDNINAIDLGIGVGNDEGRDKIVNFIYGYTHKAQSVSGVDGFPINKREWILGDIIHSEPEIIDYFDSDGNLTHRYIAVGSNDGMIHVFTDTAAIFGGKTYSSGDEVFAFIPSDLLLKLQYLPDAGVHTYMVDGSPNLFSSGTSDEKILVFGERRGGRSYWALEMTNPNPEEWKVKWHISGGSGGISTPVTKQINELGYTWSKPYFTKIKTGTDSVEDVIIFAGGYDEIEDGYPEAFIDSNSNGKRDLYPNDPDKVDEPYTNTVGGTVGVYDEYNPGKDNYGRGIFVRKMSNGSIFFKATYGEGEDQTTGIAQTYNAMKYCFPADISVISFSESNLLMYAADIYGQIWKIKYDYSGSSGSWTVKRVFTANPGSSLGSGIGDALIPQFTDNNPDTPTLDDSDQGRKTFYSPEVSYFGNEWTRNPVLYFGTGDRAHPSYTMISDRFYVVEDTDSLIDESNLLNLTCNELDVNANDVSIQSELKALFYTKKVNGFYRILDKQGNCQDSLTDHTGEKILSQPTLFNGVVYFTPYQPPVPGDPSNSIGNTFVYALDYSFGTSAYNYFDGNDQDDFNMRTIEDTFFKISDSSIPSGVKIIIRDGNTAGFISVGGKVSGVGEGQSMNIPASSGGVTQMLWEVE